MDALPEATGLAGAGALNERLQEALTLARLEQPERSHGGCVYRVGDKVTQVRDNHDKGTATIVNGSVGVVTGLSLEDQELHM